MPSFILLCYLVNLNTKLFAKPNTSLSMKCNGPAFTYSVCRKHCSNMWGTMLKYGENIAKICGKHCKNMWKTLLKYGENIAKIWGKHCKNMGKTLRKYGENIAKRRSSDCFCIVVIGCSRRQYLLYWFIAPLARLRKLPFMPIPTLWQIRYRIWKQWTFHE